MLLQELNEKKITKYYSNVIIWLSYKWYKSMIWKHHILHFNVYIIFKSIYILFKHLYLDSFSKLSTIVAYLEFDSSISICMWRLVFPKFVSLFTSYYIFFPFHRRNTRWYTVLFWTTTKMNRKAYIVTNKRHVTIAAYIVPGEVHFNITVCPPLNHEKEFNMEAAATKCISILS